MDITTLAQQLSEALNAINEGVYIVDEQKHIHFWNKAAERLSGYKAEEVLGIGCSENILRHVDEEGNWLCLSGCPLGATIQDGRQRTASVFLHHKFGHRVPVVVRASPLHDTAGKITGAIEVFTANTKRNDLLAEMEKIRKEALTDELTGIGNRKYGEVTLKQLAEGTNQGKAYGILFVDIDHFKHVNDTWGHHVGDRVLRMVAQTLAHGLREYDALCRWGGEEFVLILPNVTAETLAIAGERFRMLVERSWVDFEADQIFVTVSLGGATSRIGEAPVAAVERADANLYCSKKGGRNCVSVEVAC